MTESTLKLSQRVDAYPIRTEEDLTRALAEIGGLLRAEPGSIEEARLEVLSVLVRDYEMKHHPIPPPDPVDAIKFRLEQIGKTKKDLVGIIGSRSRVSEVLNRKRQLSLGMIRALRDKLGVPLASLVSS